MLYPHPSSRLLVRCNACGCPVYRLTRYTQYCAWCYADWPDDDDNGLVAIPTEYAPTIAVAC